MAMLIKYSEQYYQNCLDHDDFPSGYERVDIRINPSLLPLNIQVVSRLNIAFLMVRSLSPPVRLYAGESHRQR